MVDKDNCKQGYLFHFQRSIILSHSQEQYYDTTDKGLRVSHTNMGQIM